MMRSRTPHLSFTNDSVLVGIRLLVDHICYFWQVMLLAQSFLCLMLVPFCCCQLSFSSVIIESAVFLNVFWKKCNGRHSQSFEETKNISYYKFQCNKHFPLQIILSACSLGQEQSDNLSKTKKSRVTGYIQNSKCCDLYYNW